MGGGLCYIFLAGNRAMHLSNPRFSGGKLRRRVSRRTDRRILPGFRIQSEILTDFRILQLQRIADSSSFGARISDSGEILTADLVNKL